MNIFFDLLMCLCSFLIERLRKLVINVRKKILIKAFLAFFEERQK